MSNERCKPTEIDRLHSEDTVRVEIENINGDVVTTYKGSGFSKIEDAITAAYDANASLLGEMNDYVYNITDKATGICHRYRINAGGNAKLIV